MLGYFLADIVKSEATLRIEPKNDSVHLLFGCHSFFIYFISTKIRKILYTKGQNTYFPIFET